MKYPVNYKEINSDTEFYSDAVKLHNEAAQYLTGFTWCKTIKESYLYTNIGQVLCIFLFEIENRSSPEDNFLWVIVGDIPPMYLDVFGPRTTRGVIEDYVSLAQDWIDHVKNNQSTNECYPFNAEPTTALAELLEKKISFMRDSLIENIDDLIFKKPD